MGFFALSSKHGIYYCNGYYNRIYSGAGRPQFTYHQNASAMVTVLRDEDSFSTRHLCLSPRGTRKKEKKE